MMRVWLLLVLAFAVARPALAVPAPRPYATVELVAESAAPAAGRTTTLAIVITPEAGWHTYWKNPGGAGLESVADWTLPAGLSASPLAYPVPKTFTVAGIVNYVFEGETLLLADLAVPAGLARGTRLPIRLQLEYLVCDDKICVPETATRSVDLIVGDGKPDPDARGRFARARGALPAAAGWPAVAESRDARFRLGVRTALSGSLAGAYFFPVADGIIDYDAPQAVHLTDSGLVIETAAVSDELPATVEGVLRLDYADGSMGGVEIAARPGTVATGGKLLAAAAPDAGASPPPVSGALAFALAVLGGLLLNVMPCVFPILGLKALSLARAGETEPQARREALAYALGAVAACLALGAAILALRAAGASIGWAFQLQDPRVILLLFLLIVAITLNLAGLFEVGQPDLGGERLAAKRGGVGAFWTGVLAAFVATPCTGPFMGLALGAAILLPAATGLLVFAGLGLGLALPFLALGFVPALRRRLPRPGPWLLTFRRLMAVPMLLTALALLWVLSRQAGLPGVERALGAAALLGLGLWWLGLRQRAGRATLPPLLIALGSLAALPFISPLPKGAAAVGRASALPASEAFSEQRLLTLRAARTPVFVYFTADWCITCKVNETGVLAAPEVVAAFERAGVATLVGDWTNADPAITRFLERQGRAGVPLYLYFAPGTGKPVTLPQILDRDDLVEMTRGG
jgi:thiol:disulfide interchange protein/DsbC/DsbD-like thiol-disulfide interchange protein